MYEGEEEARKREREEAASHYPYRAILDIHFLTIPEYNNLILF